MIFIFTDTGVRDQNILETTGLDQHGVTGGA
jgi:hypothetical protein